MTTKADMVLMSFEVGAITVFVPGDKFTLQSWTALLNDRKPGVRLDRDIVFNYTPDAPAGFYCSTRSGFVVAEMATLAKNYSCPVKSIELRLAAIPSLYSDSVISREVFGKESLSIAVDWFARNKPRVLAEPSRQVGLSSPVFDFGVRTSRTRLRISPDGIYSWFLRGEFAQAAFSFIQLDAEGGLAGVDRAFCAVTATIASPVVFGFALPDQDRLAIPPKIIKEKRFDFEGWVATVVAEKIATYLETMPDEVIPRELEMLLATLRKSVEALVGLNLLDQAVKAAKKVGVKA